jgi:hypothetical protein
MMSAKRLPFFSSPVPDSLNMRFSLPFILLSALAETSNGGGTTAAPAAAPDATPAKAAAPAKAAKAAAHKAAAKAAAKAAQISNADDAAPRVRVRSLVHSLGEGDIVYLKGAAFTVTASRAAALGGLVEVIKE